MGKIIKYLGLKRGRFAVNLLCANDCARPISFRFEVYFIHITIGVLKNLFERLGPIVRVLSDLTAIITREIVKYYALSCRDGGHRNFMN